jgi:uncharacterized protein (TIGR00255 family)
VTFPISSMTGFARLDGAHEQWRWVWEMKSVNGRGLEIRVRMPQGFDDVEPELRGLTRARLNRGSVNINLTLQSESTDARYRINQVALDDVLSMIKQISADIKCDSPRAEAILALRGVMEPADDVQSEAARKGLIKALLASFKKAVDGLVAARASEGAAMGAVLSGLFDEVERLTNAAAALGAAAPEALRAKLHAQIGELLSGAQIPEDRLAQEAALLAVKADIREELDRLHSHIAAGRALLGERGPVGRQLDFLTQEFNREANTLCSKAPDMALKRIGLDLKKTIDQLREQVQNIE